jgi:DNA-binding FadR family transcriptional regulator
LKWSDQYCELEALVPDPVLERLKQLLVDVDRSGSRRLPPERTLTDTLNVPRGTLRERLAGLEALGIIRSAQGSGTYLAEAGEPDSEFVRLYFELALLLRRVTPEQIEAVREMLERESAKIAATLRTDEDLAGLSAALDALVAAKTPDEGDRADYEFHVAVLRATHNPVLMLVVDGLSAALRHVLSARRAAVREVPGGARITDATHRAVYRAIADGDPVAAERAMSTHFTIWSDQATRAQTPRRSAQPASASPKKRTRKVRSS